MGGNRWNILAFNFTKRDALSSVYKISMNTAWLKRKAVHVLRNKLIKGTKLINIKHSMQTYLPYIFYIS
jgi:hypothetical protein